MMNRMMFPPFFHRFSRTPYPPFPHFPNGNPYANMNSSSYCNNFTNANNYSNSSHCSNAFYNSPSFHQEQSSSKDIVSSNSCSEHVEDSDDLDFFSLFGLKLASDDILILLLLFVLYLEDCQDFSLYLVLFLLLIS